MPLVHRLLVTLRTLMEEENQPPKNRKRRSNNGGKSNRNRQTTALVLTFRDLFRSSGLDIIIDELDNSRRISRKNSNANISSRANITSEGVLCVTNQSAPSADSRLVLRDPNTPLLPSSRLIYQDETVPLLHEESFLNADLVPRPVPFYTGGLFSGLALVRRKHDKPEDLTVPLNPDDENQTVKTLKKVLKWSPRKQNSATFAVTLPTEEKHTAIAVVENAVNRVKEEQLMRKKKTKFFWLKFC